MPVLETESGVWLNEVDESPKEVEPSSTMDEPEPQWARVELVGHVTIAGRISRPAEWGGLLRVDVPNGEGDYRTELIGISSIYRIRFVSEEHATIVGQEEYPIGSYGDLVVARDEHNRIVGEHRETIGGLRDNIRDRDTAMRDPDEVKDRIPF